MDSELQPSLSPTVLREWAGHLRVWPYWAVPYRAAAALDLLADLLDAIDADPGQLRQMGEAMQDAGFPQTGDMLTAIAAVLEAHHEQ